MAYSRRQVTDFQTVMNKDLYDNLQDGIEESKNAIGDWDSSKGSIMEQMSTIEQQVGNVNLRYDEDTKYLVFGITSGSGSGDDNGGGSVDESDIITPEEAAEIFDNAENG